MTDVAHGRPHDREERHGEQGGHRQQVREQGRRRRRRRAPREAESRAGSSSGRRHPRDARHSLTQVRIFLKKTMPPTGKTGGGFFMQSNGDVKSDRLTRDFA